MSVHKAAPDDNSTSYSMCAVCGKEVKHLPAGQGWVHEATGTVVGTDPWPTFSVTFILDSEQYCVPFTNEASAREYHHQVPVIYPDALNVVVNDLST